MNNKVIKKILEHNYQLYFIKVNDSDNSFDVGCFNLSIKIYTYKFFLFVI